MNDVKGEKEVVMKELGGDWWRLRAQTSNGPEQSGN